MALLSNALTTLSLVKLESGVDDLDTAYDILFENMINSVSQTFEKYLNRRLGRNESITEETRSYNKRDIVLRYSPIVSVASVQYVTYDGFLTDLSYTISDKSAAILHLSLGYNGSVIMASDIVGSVMENSYRDDIKVVYGGGYNLPNDLSPNALYEDLPFDISMAAAKEVAILFQSKGRDVSIRSEKLSDHEISYFSQGSSGFALSDFTRSVLSSYRRFVGV